MIAPFIPPSHPITQSIPSHPLLSQEGSLPGIRLEKRRPHKLGVIYKPASSFYRGVYVRPSGYGLDPILNVHPPIP